MAVKLLFSVLLTVKLACDGTQIPSSNEAELSNPTAVRDNSVGKLDRKCKMYGFSAIRRNDATSALGFSAVTSGMSLRVTPYFSDFGSTSIYTRANYVESFNDRM